MEEETPMIHPIYISHNWGQTDALTESVTAQFNKEGIHYIIDKKDMTCGDDIRNFEDELSKGDAVLAIIDDAYLKSTACMYELAKVFEKGQAISRLVVILDVDNKKFRDTDTMLAYQEYWEKEKAIRLDKIGRMKGAESGIETRQLNDISLILRMLPIIWNTWQDLIYARSRDLKTEQGMQTLSAAIRKKYEKEEIASQIKREDDGRTMNFTQYGNNNKIFKIGTINGDAHFS